MIVNKESEAHKAYEFLPPKRHQRQHKRSGSQVSSINSSQERHDEKILCIQGSQKLKGELAQYVDSEVALKKEKNGTMSKET